MVLKPGGWTRSWNRAGLKKKQGKKKSGVTWRLGQDPVANLFIFFIIKMTSF
jgi:hypothetical protein